MANRETAALLMAYNPTTVGESVELVSLTLQLPSKQA